MDSDSSGSDGIYFNYFRFIKFLRDNNIMATTISAVLSYALRDFINDIVENTVVAVIDKDSDNDGVKDFHKMENKKINIFGIKFGTGKIFISFIKFMVVLYITFIIMQLINKKFSK